MDPHRFFGRRKGPKLTNHQAGLMIDLLPKLLIPLGQGDKAVDPFYFFEPPVTKIWFEIGFGKGEHLAALARAHPDIGFIGCEPYLNGVASLLSVLDQEGLHNVRLYTDDARHILRGLKPGSLDRLFLLHPDPWPKTRHAKRRFIGPKNLDLISAALGSGGEFRVGTDHPLYARWTVMQMARRPEFRWRVDRVRDWCTKPADWPDTRYESKAIEGDPVYLRYERL